MSFWQENYSFMKDVYDSRAEKMVSLMDKTETAMTAVHADTIYTSVEFKKVKETFMTMARNLEQPETKEWLSMTKETLMSEKTGKDIEEENKKLNSLIDRYDTLVPKINDTKAVVDCLWKSYQYTDELSPLIEWIEDMSLRSTREISSNSGSQTEELIEKQEKNLDLLDKKKKMVNEQRLKGEKILSDPKCPKFMFAFIDKLKDLWARCNNEAEKRLKDLKENYTAWEKYENERDGLKSQINEGKQEYKSLTRVFDLTTSSSEFDSRSASAKAHEKNLLSSFENVVRSHEILIPLLGDDMKGFLASEIENLKNGLSIIGDTQDKLKDLSSFNERLKVFHGALQKIENWLSSGQSQMCELLSPKAENEDPQERVMATMELQSDIQVQMESFEKLVAEWKEFLAPQSPDEHSAAFEKRLETVSSVHKQLFDDVQKEGEKFGEDVKYLADFTAGIKRFEPWLLKSESRKKSGLLKPKNLIDAEKLLLESQTWKSESEENSRILEDSYASASKMTLHKDADEKYKDFSVRWKNIDEEAESWILKYTDMVAVWRKQAETAEKVTSALSSTPEGSSEMKLEDLENHLNALKQMFIQKQKMMEEMKEESGNQSGEKNLENGEKNYENDE